MTARGVISSFMRDVPTLLDEETLAYWISEIEGTIISEVVLTHEGAPDGAPEFAGITASSGMDDELTAKEPYSKLYFDYLRMKSDVLHSDTVRFDASSAIFAASYADFADHYNRTHMPLCAAKLTIR